MTEGAENKLRSILSLSQAAYTALLELFSPLVRKKLRLFTLKNVRRHRLCYREQPNSSLLGDERKLEFILSYLKENPTQTYHGHFWGLSQAKASEWVAFLSPVLEEALEKLGVMPQTGTSYEHRDTGSAYLLMDVTEREIPRRTGHEAQKEEYSGKKKYHTLKNLVIADPKGYVHFLSQSYEGTVHDKALWDDLLVGPMEQNMLADLGFLGIDHTHPNALMPFKKPKKKPLTHPRKQINTIISRMRVVIEHVFAGIKILRIIGDKIRLKSYDSRDRVMRIAAAMHNLRMSFREPVQHQT